MGIFSFITDAGGSLGSAVYDLVNSEENTNQATALTPERVNAVRKASIEKLLVAEFSNSVKDVSVEVDNSLVILTGHVATQELSEKITLCVGNKKTISSVDCQLTTDTAEEPTTFYTVKSGDTLSKIAKEFYGNAGKYPLIFEANKPMLSDPNKIYPGQSLRIPTVD